MFENEKKTMQYRISIISNDYPKHPLELDMMAFIYLPDGRCIQQQVVEDLSLFLKDEYIPIVSHAISCRLIESLQKEIQRQVAEIVMPMKKYMP